MNVSQPSSYADATPSATTFTLLAAVWFIIVQWLSSGLGGYLTGRLRTKWAGLHTDKGTLPRHCPRLPRLGARHGSDCRLRHVFHFFGHWHCNASGFECSQRRNIRCHAGYGQSVAGFE